MGPTVAVDRDGTVHVAWTEGLTGENTILHRHLASGQFWSEPENLTEGFTYVSATRLMTDPDGRQCIFWRAATPEAALYVRCLSEGQWSTAEQAVEQGGLTLSYVPGFLPDGRIVAAYVVPPSHIWLGEVELTADGVTAAEPAFAVDANGGLHVAWRQFANQTSQVDGMAYRYSGDGGASWDEEELLNEEGLSAHQLLADPQGNVHWMARDGTYRRWTAAQGWSDATNAAGAQLVDGFIAVGEDGLARAVFPARDGVYLTRQIDDTTWTTAVLVEATADLSVSEAVLAVEDSGNLHLVWVTLGDNPTLLYLALALGSNDEALPASIGSATMEADGTIVLNLIATGGGITGHGVIEYHPDHPDYQMILDHLGGLKPGQTKPVPPFPDE